MLRQILVVLGIGTIVAGYSSTTFAQSSVPFRDNNSVTLSGDSLRTVESRQIVSDYQNFFNKILPTAQTNSVTNVGRLTASPQRPLLGEQPVDLVGDNINTERTLLSFPSRSDAGDTEKVKLQLQLGNQ